MNRIHVLVAHCPEESSPSASPTKYPPTICIPMGPIKNPCLNTTCLYAFWSDTEECGTVFYWDGILRELTFFAIMLYKVNINYNIGLYRVEKK